MIVAMSGLSLKGVAAAFDEAVTTGVQRKRTVSESSLTCCRPSSLITTPPRFAFA